MILVPFLTLLSPSALAEWPSGTVFDEAINLDITEPAFEVIAEAAPALIPGEPIEIPDLYEHDVGYDPLFGWIEIWEYEFSASNLWLQMELSDLTVTPYNGYLAVEGEAVVWVNDAADPAVISAWAEGLDLLSIGDACDLALQPFGIEISTTIALDVTEDGAITVDVGELNWNTDVSGEDLLLDNCTIGDIHEFFQWLGIDLFDLLWPITESLLDSTVQGIGDELETLTEDAFTGLVIDTEIDLLGTLLGLYLGPSAIDVTTEGVRLVLAGSIDTEPSDCLPVDAQTGSVVTANDTSSIGDYPVDIETTPHVAVLVDDDFANNALYGIYSAGTLCLSIDDSTMDLPLELNTSVLSFLHAGYADRFEEAIPISIRTTPGVTPPIAYADGRFDFNMAIDDLELDFYGEIDGRPARILGTTVDADVGINLDFDQKTGLLAIDLPLSGDDLSTRVSHNEFLPGEDQAIADGFSPLFDTLVAPLLGSLTSDLQFELPALGTLGVSIIEAAPSGTNLETFGLFADVGEVKYFDPKSDGCDLMTGKDSGCDGGCNGGVPFGATLYTIPILFGLLRRRNTQK